MVSLSTHAVGLHRQTRFALALRQAQDEGDCPKP